MNARHAAQRAATAYKDQGDATLFTHYKRTLRGRALRAFWREYQARIGPARLAEEWATATDAATTIAAYAKGCRR